MEIAEKLILAGAVVVFLGGVYESFLLREMAELLEEIEEVLHRAGRR